MGFGLSVVASLNSSPTLPPTTSKLLLRPLQQHTRRVTVRPLAEVAILNATTTTTM